MFSRFTSEMERSPVRRDLKPVEERVRQFTSLRNELAKQVDDV